MTCCADLDDELMIGVSSLPPEVRARFEEVSVDATNWISEYRCNVCGQRWQEVYVATGRYEAPRLRKRA